MQFPTLWFTFFKSSETILEKFLKGKKKSTRSEFCSLSNIVTFGEWHWVVEDIGFDFFREYRFIRKGLSVLPTFFYFLNNHFRLYTMLHKLSKFEIRAWLCWNLIILLPLRFCLKSNFGKYKKSKNVIFSNLETLNFEIW